MAHVLDLGKPLTPNRELLRSAWLSHSQHNVWTWTPATNLWEYDLSRVNLLIAAHWKRIPHDQLNPSLVTLYGQMSTVISLALPGGARERWAAPEDIERLERAPVALAFTLPDEQLGELAVTIATSEETGEPLKVLNMTQWLPPPNYGERALVLHDGVFQMRTAAALGEQGAALQARLSKKLLALAEPIGWLPWVAQLEHCRTQQGYEQYREQLRSEILAHRGKEREPYKAQLDALEVIHKHAAQIALTAKQHVREADTWLASLAEVATMAQQLAALYWDVEQGADRLADEQAQRTPPDVASVFDADDMAQVPSPLPALAVANAYSAAQRGGWGSDDNGIPTYRQTTEGHDTAIQVRGADDAAILDDAQMRQLWQQVGELSDLDADVFLAMLAQYAAHPGEPGGVWLTAKQILDYRGIQPKHNRGEHGLIYNGGHRQEDIAEIARCVARQANQWIHINSRIGDATAGKRRKVMYRHVSKLTLIEEVIYQQELIPEPGKPPSKLPIAWRFRIGTWLEPFLTVPNRQMASLCQQALRYDPYRQQWEKRLARYFVFHMRINAARGAAYLPRHVGKLLDELSLPIDERHPERTQRRFGQALDQLVNDGVIDHWEYAKGNPALPARGWLATWREWRVNIWASALTTERQAQIAAKAQTRRDRAEALGTKQSGKRATDD